MVQPRSSLSNYPSLPSLKYQATSGCGTASVHGDNKKFSKLSCGHLEFQHSKIILIPWVHFSIIIRHMKFQVDRPMENEWKFDHKISTGQKTQTDGQNANNNNNTKSYIYQIHTHKHRQNTSWGLTLWYETETKVLPPYMREKWMNT